MSTSYDCPNCGASVRDDGVNESVRCRFCGTHVEMPHRRRARTRGELEAEREQILAREGDLDERIQQAGKRGVADFVVPPVGCCGIYFGLFVAGSLILTAISKEVARTYGTAVAGIAIAAALIGVVLIIWRRETRRRERVIALEREKLTDRALRQDRLREIDAQLETLSE